MILITEMLEICLQASYDQNVKLILKSYIPVRCPLKLVFIEVSVPVQENERLLCGVFGESILPFSTVATA